VTEPHPRRLRLAVAPVVLGLVLGGGLTACSGDDGTGGDPDKVLSTAKKKLDETPGVHLELETPELPDGVSGLVKADGIATHQPAFEGKIDVVYSGITATVPVTAVDGVVHAVLPFTEDYVEVDPADYGAPDPAALMDPDSGISAWLTAATGVSEGDKTREGGDVLSTYRGTLAGSTVAKSIPSADEGGEFDATFKIDEDGLLRTASLTGAFYAGEPELTYDITLTDYGTEKEITAP
jgi:lipoprotein LprG